MNKKAILIVSICCALAIGTTIFVVVVKSLFGGNVDENTVSQTIDSSTLVQAEPGEEDFEESNQVFDIDDVDSEVIPEGSVITLTPTILTDNYNIGAFYTFVPDGWIATVNTEYMVDQIYPLQSDIIMKSPDGKYVIEMITPMNFHDNDNQDGNRTADDESHKIMEYTTLLHYRNASQYIDYITSKNGFSWGEYEEFEGNRDEINAYKEKVRQSGEDTVRLLQDAANYSGGSTFNVRYSLTDYNAEIISRRGVMSGSNGSQYTEITCYDGMYKYRNDYDIPNNLIELKFWNDITYWGTQGIYVYASETKEDFDKYYDMAKFIMSNSGTTGMYDACKQQIISYMIPKIVEGQQEVMNYANDIMQEVVSGYNQTNDRVAQMWDDYILDQDRYTMSDGTQIVVPTTANYVYYDGTDVVWSEYASYDPGAGYERIN